MSQLPIAVHVATNDLAWWDEVEARQRAQTDTHNVFLNNQVRPPLADPSLDWDSLGLDPRWLGYDTADCAAALAPSVYAGRGADEFRRFRDGAAGRGETALAISPIGNTDPDQPRPMGGLFRHDDHVMISGYNVNITSRPLGKGARVHAAGDLDAVDSQLASRLINCRPALPWRTLHLNGMTFESVHGTEDYPAVGIFVPVVITELGEPVVAIWVSPDEVERRYIVPAETPWPALLAWLTETALPELASGPMRRARRHMSADPTLNTAREQAAHEKLAALDASYAEQREALLEESAAAQAEAARVRDGLLYGRGAELVDAVSEAFRSAGIVVTDLDQHLGGTKNADLLCSFAGHARLVEVKSAAGSASESMYDALESHLREWPNLARTSPVDGGALVVNHQLRKPPHERDTAAYSRREFLDAKTHPVITTLEIFEAWRIGDTRGMVGLLFGATPTTPSTSGTPAGSPSVSATRSTPTSDGDDKLARRHGWFRRRSGQ